MRKISAGVRRLSGHTYPWVVSERGTGRYLSCYPTREEARTVARDLRAGRETPETISL